MAKNKKPIEWWKTKFAACGEAGIMLAAGAIFSYLKPNYGIPTLVVLFCISILLLWKAYKKAPILIPSILIILGVIGVSMGQSYFNESKQLNFATPDALTSPVLQNMDIRINDLAREDFVIRNRTFDNCHIYGPAMIYPINCIMMNNYFRDVDMNSGLVVTTNKTVSGAIQLDKCVIKNCTFHKISFIGSAERIEYIRKASEIK